MTKNDGISALERLKEEQSKLERARNSSNKASISLESMPEETIPEQVHSYVVDAAKRGDNRRYYYFFDGSIVAVDDGLMMEKDEIEAYSKLHGPVTKMKYSNKFTFYTE